MIPFYLIYFFIFTLGAILGSFYNVCIYRIPKEESVVKPRSKCPHCGTLIKWYQNIPIISWFVLRGKCAKCSAKISPRYIIVEILTGVLFVLGYIFMGSWPLILVSWLFMSTLLIGAFIDLEHMIIPDRFTIGGFMVGILLSIGIPEIHGYAGADLFIIDGLRGLMSGMTGAFVGSGLLLWIALVAESIVGEEAMGFGDVKLMGFIGAVLGWQGAIFAVFGGAFVGCFLYFPMKWGGVRDETGEMRQVPFGPALSIAAVLYMLFMGSYIDSYFEGIRLIFS